VRTSVITLMVWAPGITVVLAACGGAHSAPTIGPPPPLIGPGTRADLRVVRQAAAHTLKLRALVSLEFAAPASVGSTPIVASGYFDFQRASGTEFVHDPSGTETLVFQPATVFDRPPGQAAMALPQGRPWIRADFNEHVKGSSLAQFLLLAEGRDPGFLLAEVAWGARGAAPLPRRVVNGEATTGYEVDVDPALAVEAASGARARGFSRTAAFVEQALGTGAAQPPGQAMRIWVDRSHRIVSIRTSPAGSGVGTTLMTMTAFGVQVRPNPPVQSQTVDLAALTPAGDFDHD
jgi:hypothetical protein